jgi:hypothetical protein
MLDMGLRIKDWATKQVQDRTRLASKAHSDALAASGFRLRQLTQTGMRQQAPGDVSWPAPSPWVQYGSSLAGRARMARRRLARRKRAPKQPPPLLYGSKGRTPLKKLAGGVRYEKQTQPGPGGSIAKTTVRMGFLNAKLASLAAYHAEDHTVPVTPKMRRLLFAVGLGISKSTIHIPARPHVEPVYRKNHARIPGFVQQRINTAWAGGDPKGVTAPF